MLAIDEQVTRLNSVVIRILKHVPNYFKHSDSLREGEILYARIHPKGYAVVDRGSVTINVDQKDFKVLI